ncbi:hypothetical protein [Blastopirellula retiformator]|uniref:hypothetical protein n=1 Tax=Blastopirellula retiformator TaxID=2527970 RepID=UPI0011B6FE09|nr:hypothetical protein [Blastopirellula retiformator]
MTNVYCCSVAFDGCSPPQLEYWSEPKNRGLIAKKTQFGLAFQHWQSVDFLNGLLDRRDAIPK